MFLFSAVQQSDSVIHRYICILFLCSFFMVYLRILNIVPHSIQKDLGVFPFYVFNSLHLSLNSQFIPLPPLKNFFNGNYTCLFKKTSHDKQLVWKYIQ